LSIFCTFTTAFSFYKKVRGVKKLHILVLKSFIGPFILIFFIVLFILLMQFLWRYIDDLIGKGLEIKIIAELLLYTSSSLVPMALPLSILMSSLMTFGNMGEFYELTAIKSSGISLQRIMMPLIVLVFFIGIGAFFFANEVLPYTNLKMRSLLYDVRNQRPEISIMPGTFYNGVDGYSMRVDSKDPSTNMMYNIKIYDHTEGQGNVSVSIADSGKMIVTEDERNLIFTLYHGYSYNELEDPKDSRRRKTYPHRYDQFDEQKIIIQLTGFSLTRTDENLFRNHYSMLDLAQLTRMGDSIMFDINYKENQLNDVLVTSNYFKKREVSPSPQQSPDMPPVSRIAKNANPAEVKKSPANAFGDELFNLKRDSIKKSRDKSKISSPPQKPNIATKKKSNTDPELYKNLPELLTTKELDNVLSSALSLARASRTYIVSSSNAIESKVGNLRRYEIEWHRKFTIAFACLVFLFIGAPLGAIIRKGGLGLPLVISTLLFIFYYIISLMGEKIVRESLLGAFQGMWFAPMLFFITGIFLTYKATTDSAILNFETYSIFIRKYLGIKRSNIVEAVLVEKVVDKTNQVKYENLIASLSSFRDSADEAIEEVESQLKLSGYLMSLLGIRESSNILLFERLYKNIVLRIIESKIFDDRSVKNKLTEFPDFSYRKYLDLKWRLFLRLILLLIPPVTLIILIRHFIQLSNLKSKLHNIIILTDDLILLLKKNQLVNE